MSQVFGVVNGSHVHFHAFKFVQTRKKLSYFLPQFFGMTLGCYVYNRYGSLVYPAYFLGSYLFHLVFLVHEIRVCGFLACFMPGVSSPLGVDLPVFSPNPLS